MSIDLKSLCVRLTTVGVAVAAGAALCASSAAVAHDAKHHAAAAAKADVYQRSVRSYSIPDVVLIDSDARPVRLRELLAAQEPVMMNFVFTTCATICPVMSRVFSEVPAQLGAEAQRLRMISISIDPENDTPARLKAYARKFEAGARWEFLTGRLQDIKTVERAFDSYRGDKMNHEPLTLLRGAPSKQWVRIDGFASPQDLAREYESAVLK